jgi:hypothetical protein
LLNSANLFRTQFSQVITFYGLLWISGAQTPHKSCFYNNKTMIPTKTPRRIFSKHSLILCTISASFGEPLAHKTHILIALISWCVFGIPFSRF